jgi:hypothetical protein
MSRIRLIACAVAPMIFVVACGGGSNNSAEITSTALGPNALTDATTTPSTIPASTPNLPSTSSLNPAVTTQTTPNTEQTTIAAYADILACPSTAPGATVNETWYPCLVGKRFVGTDPKTGQICELRFQTNGVFGYAKEGVVISSTPPIANWTKINLGYYENSNRTLVDGSTIKTFDGEIGGYTAGPDPVDTPRVYAVVLTVLKFSKTAFNASSAKFKIPGTANGDFEVCDLNI